MGKKRQKAATVNKPEGALDVDGTNCDTFIDESVKGSGLSREDWLKKFNEASQNTSHPANITDGASMKSWLDGIYSSNGYGTSDGKGVYGTLNSIQKENSTYKTNSAGKSVLDKSFLYDPAWQYKTSAKYESRTLKEDYTKEELKQHLKDGSWVQVTTGKGKDEKTEVYERGETKYLDPSKLNLIARPKGEGQLGDIYKVTDANDPNNSTYAMLFDRSPAAKANSVTEVSNPVFTSLGKTADPVKGTTAKLNQERLGHSDLYDQFKKTGKVPTQEEINEAGKKLDPKSLKPKPDTPNTGAFQINQCTDDSVRLGKKKLPAAYAATDCKHTGNGSVADGSKSVFLYPRKVAFARVTDPTTDNYEVFTGEDSLEVA